MRNKCWVIFGVVPDNSSYGTVCQLTPWCCSSWDGTPRTVGALKRLYKQVSCLQSTSHKPLKTDLDYLHLEKVLKRFSTTTLGNIEFLLACDCHNLPKMSTLRGFAPYSVPRGLLLKYKWQITKQSLFIQQIIHLFLITR